MKANSIPILFCSTLIYCLLLFCTISTPILPEGIHPIKVGKFQDVSINKSETIMAYYDLNQDGR